MVMSVTEISLNMNSKNLLSIESIELKKNDVL